MMPCFDMKIGMSKTPPNLADLSPDVQALCCRASGGIGA